MDIRVGELRNKEVIALLQEHHKDMLSHSPVESVHALDLNALEAPDITFWSFWINNKLAGVGALKEIDAEHGEIKSMRTSNNHLRKGVAENLLKHILFEKIGISDQNILDIENYIHNRLQSHGQKNENQ